MKEAIELAIKGGLDTHKGYKFTHVRWIGGNTRTVVDLIHNYTSGSSTLCTSAEELFLNPNFWEALGESLGWGNSFGFIQPGDTGEIESWLESDSVGTVFRWEFEWHRFISHLADRKSADSFFKELLAMP